MTTDVENYPGYPRGGHGTGDDGRSCASRPSASARAFSPTTRRASTSQRAAVPPRLGRGRRVQLPARVIVATGASARWLGVPGEASSPGRGVSSYARPATARSSRRSSIVVVGGGDSAMEEAMFLALRHEGHGHPPPRRVSRVAGSCSIARARDENIEFLTPYVVEELLARRERSAGRGPPAQRGDRRGARAGAVRCLRRDRPRAAVTSSCAARSTLDPNGYVLVDGRSTSDQPPGRLRGRRPRRPHLPPGGDGGRLRLSGRARRGVVPARHPVRWKRAPAAAARRSGVRPGALPRAQRDGAVRRDARARVRDDHQHRSTMAAGRHARSRS